VFAIGAKREISIVQSPDEVRAMNELPGARAEFVGEGNIVGRICRSRAGRDEKIGAQKASCSRDQAYRRPRQADSREAHEKHARRMA
jgi:hypothetical protein